MRDIWNKAPLDGNQLKVLRELLAEAETKSTGKIMVHMDGWCKTSALFKAKNRFAHFRLDRLKGKNGVLIYLAYKEGKLAVVCGSGISSRVAPDLWDQLADEMRALAEKGDYFSALHTGVVRCTEQLVQHYPGETQ